jgi:hypothetical protein
MEHFIARDLKLTSFSTPCHNRTEEHTITFGESVALANRLAPKERSPGAQIQQNKNTNQRHMSSLYYSFIMSFLKENHPEILKTIDKIYEPDLTKISKVIDCYCKFTGVPALQIMGEYIKYKDIQHRYKAIAVVLRIFQPEKLDNLKTKVKSNIYKELGPYLKINNDTLQKSIICACNQFDMYSDFKKDVKQAANYYLINTRFNDE